MAKFDRENQKLCDHICLQFYLTVDIYIYTCIHINLFMFKYLRAMTPISSWTQNALPNLHMAISTSDLQLGVGTTCE